MFNSKKARSLLVAMSLSLFLSNLAYAATYKVAPGDSIQKVSKLFNTSATKIMKDNKLSSSKITPGKTLNIPSKTYTVKKGDSLYSIAKKHGISVDALRKINSNCKTVIYAGQKLNIPASSKSPISTNTAKAKVQTNTKVKPKTPAKPKAKVKASTKPKAKVKTTAKAKAKTKPKSTTTASRGNIAYSARELDLLARLITAEADGQPYKAQVAVGAVVLNRVKDSRFPNSISAVIYERSAGYYQFTPVLNGWINKPATSQAKKAAYEALRASDPTRGALYYFDDSTNNKWLRAKTVTLKLGKMIFTKY